MSVDKIILVIFGVLLIVGAFFGFKAGSIISLIMGLLSGVLIFIGLYLAGNSPRIGYGIITATSSLLIVVFIIRFAKTQKFMPSGMLILASLVALIVGISQLLKK